jgi:hypothetical protein
MNRSFTAVLLLAIMLTACKKDLELTPVSYITPEVFFKNENDIDGAINGIYVKLRNDAVINLYIWGEARSDMLTNALAGTLGYDRYYNNSLNTELAGPEWNNLYATINAANLILKYAPDISFSTESKKNNALAQAYTMRAFVYFTLARTWGDVPLRTAPTESYDPATIQVPRSPVKDVFTLIKADLDNALKLFPDNAFPDGRTKWSKPAASALKGDVYLWTAKRLNGGEPDLRTALAALDSIQGVDAQLLPNYGPDIFFAKGNKELLMALRFSFVETGANTAGVAGNMDFHPSNAPNPATVSPATAAVIGVIGGNSVWQMSEQVRSQFTDDDKRKNATYFDVMRTSGPNPFLSAIGIKFRGEVVLGARQYTNDYILYRYADVLLMKAEARNALNMDPTAEINQIRQRAYGDHFPDHVFTAGNKAENDSAILRERLFEFALEGKRWWDVVRFGKAFELVPSLKGKESQQHLLYWPVGITLRTKEPQVTETPGW